MKPDQKPLKTEYYIGYYDKLNSKYWPLIEKFFMTENQRKFRTRLIEIIQNPRYVYTESIKVCYFDKEVEVYELYKIEEKRRWKEPLTKFEEWKKTNNIRSRKDYVFQPEMDIQKGATQNAEL